MRSLQFFIITIFFTLQVQANSLKNEKANLLYYINESKIISVAKEYVKKDYPITFEKGLALQQVNLPKSSFSNSRSAISNFGVNVQDDSIVVKFSVKDKTIKNETVTQVQGKPYYSTEYEQELVIVELSTLSELRKIRILKSSRTSSSRTKPRASFGE